LTRFNLLAIRPIHDRRGPMIRISRVVLISLVGAGCTGSPQVETLLLPDGTAGIGLDDLRYSPAMRGVLVPAGRTGNVDIVDRRTRTVSVISGFSADAAFDGGHDFGATSVEEVDGMLYVTDRTTEQLYAVDPVRGTIVGAVDLAASPDYVRDAGDGELWVTEPDAEQIEIFRRADLTSIATIAVPGGPESLVIDGVRGRAYAHADGGLTVAIELAGRAVVDTWSNGCALPKGIALDADRGLLVVGCGEGTLVSIDVAGGGAVVGQLAYGNGLDVLGYDPQRHHLYAPGGKSGSLGIVDLAADGGLHLVRSVATASGAHCATSDGAGTIYVCDPEGGGLLLIED
jgi:outer membrane protein assembly factor BamB